VAKSSFSLCAVTKGRRRRERQNENRALHEVLHIYRPDQFGFRFARNDDSLRGNRALV